ncbi:hypothetical protein [Ekhidna sp.]|uniref:hypothetical protein n=1 Tax=Ekhidna sp. TaxID=2608089 RepID=UPI003BA9B2A5
MSRKDLKSKFKHQERELRTIINSWELIPGSPSDEFDSLNHKLLGFLRKKVDKEKINKIIHSDLITYYGLSINQEMVDEFTKEVIKWWDNQ